MQQGLKFSIILHCCLILLIIFGLPTFHRDLQTDYAIVTDVVTVSELTNVRVKQSDQKDKLESQTKKAPAAQEAKTEEEKKPDPKPEPKPEPKTEPKADADAEKIPDKKAPKEDKKPEKKQDKKPDDKTEKPKKKEESFEQTILKSIEQEKKKKNQKVIDKDFKDLEEALKGDTNKDYNPNIPMSISEIDAIKSQIVKKWNTSAFSGANSMGMRVVVVITLDMDANVISVAAKEESNSSPYYQAFVASCIRAVKAASPLQNLSKEKYGTWKEIEFTFDSSGMIF